LVERDVAIEALIAAGLRMVNADPKRPWTAKEVHKKVTKAVDRGMLKPLDGEESFRATQEALNYFFANPQFQKDVEDLLLEEEAKRKAEQPEPGPQPQEQQEQPQEQPQHQEHRAEPKKEQLGRMILEPRLKRASSGPSCTQTPCMGSLAKWCGPLSRTPRAIPLHCWCR
jgi:hypothetical protein